MEARARGTAVAAEHPGPAACRSNLRRLTRSAAAPGPTGSSSSCSRLCSRQAMACFQRCQAVGGVTSCRPARHPARSRHRSRPRRSSRGRGRGSNRGSSSTCGCRWRVRRNCAGLTGRTSTVSAGGLLACLPACMVLRCAERWCILGLQPTGIGLSPAKMCRSPLVCCSANAAAPAREAGAV